MPTGNGLVGLAARKQPLTGRFQPPIGSQQFQKPETQPRLTVFAAFAAAYPDDVAGAIDVARPESGDLGDPGSSGIHGGQQCTMGKVTRCFEQGLDFFPAQDGRELPLPSWEWNSLNANLPVQCLRIEEPQRRDHLDIRGLREPAFLDQKQLIGADVLRAKLVRRFAKMLGELRDLQNVGSDGGGGVVANLEILQHSLS